MSSTPELFVTKVFDHGCEICAHMSKHDRATFESFPTIGYQEARLDDIINHGGDRTKFRLYQLLEKHCLSPTYEIDLPVYLMMTPKGDYRGHWQGAGTIAELREKLQESLDLTGVGP